MLYLTTALLDPGRFVAIGKVAASLQPLLPPDYKAFLQEYGPGTYCGGVCIGYPDDAIIPATFGEYPDLWDLDGAYTEADLRHSTQLAWTHNGDILCMAPNHGMRVFVLPRHSEQVSSYSSFFEAVGSLLPTENATYFDPSFDAVLEQISLIADGCLRDIDPLHRSFQERFIPDFVANASTQPTYFIRAFGGWVSFDLIYRNTITVKYQQQYAPLVRPVLSLLHQRQD